MSTSDMVLLISLKNQNKIMNRKIFNHFFNKLENLMMKLSHYIVKDGEGAKKFITINVSGTDTKEKCKKNCFFDCKFSSFLKLRWQDQILIGEE